MAKEQKVDEGTGYKKVGLFDHVTALSESKQYTFDELNCSEYAPFMINSAFKQHLDTILLANEMNKRPGLSKLMHYDFMFYAIDPKRRYGKWAKQVKVNEVVIDYIKQIYHVNNDVALLYYSLYSEKEITEIEEDIKTKVGRKK